MPEVTTEDQAAGADAAASLATEAGPAVPPPPKPKRPWVVDFYSSDIGKKWVMAVTGLMLLGFVLIHMIGNLKVFIGPADINLYGESLRDLGGHLVPRTSLLWIMRIGLIAAFGLHILAAAQLTASNRRARGERSQSKRDYAAANFASRTMRWTGVIVAAFIVYHLLDLTWGVTNPDFVRGDPYDNLVASFERVPVAVVYIVANILLGIHIFHGAWSMFQSLGLNNPRFNLWRRYFAVGFASLIVVGNVSMPLAVQLGIVS